MSLSKKLTVFFFTLIVASPLQADDRPKLLVVVSVDQLAQDYFFRFADNFAEEGLFHRVRTAGAQYTQCHHRHAYTITAPGHAVQMTGTYPHVHGIIGNNWYDRYTGKNVYCMADPDTRVIGASAGDGVSPRSLLAETTGDVLRIATGKRSRVFGVAIKDRAAILMTGHSADAIFWLENEGWVTSSYYREDLPGYLRVINEGQQLKRYEGQAWNLMLPKERYHNDSPDKNTWENPPKGMTGDFPHRIGKLGEVSRDEYANQVLYSPYGNEVTLEVAREIVIHERLGQDEFPDILCINLSSNDFIGHAFGPHSLEVEDMTYQTDRQLGQLADFLDKQVGSGKWTIAVTADHGVAPIVEFAVQSKLPAKRSPLGRLDQVKAKLETHLRSNLGIETTAVPLIDKVEDHQVYLKHDHPLLAGANRSLAQRIIRDWYLAQPDVVTAMTSDELASGGGDRLADAMHRAWHPRRSGDVLIVYRPYCVPGSRGTTHGSPWQYDTHVPMMLLGAGIQHGEFDRRVSPGCLASTASVLLGVDYPPANEEEPLREALKP